MNKLPAIQNPAHLQPGKVNVAVDHSDRTLKRYLTEFDLPVGVFSEIRESLVRLVAKSEVDFMVVSADELSLVRSCLPSERIILGLPDENDLQAAIRALCSANEFHGESLSMIKAGFRVVPGDLLTIRKEAEGLAALSGANVILEPYFSAGMELEGRGSFLRSVTTMWTKAGIRAFKLDVQDAISDAPTYAASVGVIPWYARSDGLSFEEFRICVSHARRFGCAGVIAGAAIWRSTLPMLIKSPSNPQVLHAINNRLEQLRDIFN